MVSGKQKCIGRTIHRPQTAAGPRGETGTGSPPTGSETSGVANVPPTKNVILAQVDSSGDTRVCNDTAKKRKPVGASARDGVPVEHGWRSEKRPTAEAAGNNYTACLATGPAKDLLIERAHPVVPVDDARTRGQ